MIEGFLAPNVVDDCPVDGGRVPMPSSSSFCLLLTDKALMEEMVRFLAGKSSIPNGPLGGGSFSSVFSLCIDDGCFVGRTDSLISLREQDRGILEDVYKPLCMLSIEEVVVKALENQPKVV